MTGASALPVADPAPYRALVHPPGTRRIEVIDQRALPHVNTTVRIATADAAALAIRRMWVRGAPLIGAVGAYGLALALDADASDAGLEKAHRALDATRPTAVNLRWALDRVRNVVAPLPVEARADAAWREADAIAAEDVAINRAIGDHGLPLLRELAARRPGPVRVMTHCNAGALATCGWGTATAALFLAHAEGIPLHVYVSETRPRLQGANLTTWEMRQRGIAYTLFVDGASGLLMQRRDVDIVIVGADRVTRNGDVCNKIGTYDKALAAADNGVPFYVALPSPTLDPALDSGAAIPIEIREPEEILAVAGSDEYGHTAKVSISPSGSHVVNYAFDVTPARLVTGLITERGVAKASAEDLARLFPDRMR
jgi:methylthioribose-1-phosphate isomerase